MGTSGAVTLGELVGRIDHLEVRCRRGRLRLARLVAEHGAETKLPRLAVRLAADCPRAKAPDPGTRCFVRFPHLADLS
jgi:hypothetical protein